MTANAVNATIILYKYFFTAINFFVMQSNDMMVNISYIMNLITD